MYGTFTDFSVNDFDTFLVIFEDIQIGLRISPEIKKSFWELKKNLLQTVKLRITKYSTHHSNKVKNTIITFVLPIVWSRS